MSGCAWVTLATNDTYCLGALVLAHSLKRVSTSHQLAIIITPQVSPSMREQLSKVFNVVQVVDVLDSQDATNLALLQRPDLGVTFTKIHCWTLTQFSKCVFLDADTLVMQNCDELMEREELSAAPDPGWPDCFNSGVFVFVPSLETFKQLIQFASTHGSFDGGDQGLLNMYFNDWPTHDIRRHLSFLYNMCATSTYTYLPALNYYGANIKIVHFIGANKPWLLGPSGAAMSTFTQAWWDHFQSNVVQLLNRDMSGLAGALGSKEKSAIEEQWRKQNWEQGNIDFTGKDSFENIWQKILEAVNKPKPVETPKPSEKIEDKPLPPAPKEIASQAIPEKEKADIPAEAAKEGEKPIDAAKEVVPPVPVAQPPTPEQPIPMPPPTPEATVPQTEPVKAPEPVVAPVSPILTPSDSTALPVAPAKDAGAPADLPKPEESIPKEQVVLVQAAPAQSAPVLIGEQAFDAGDLPKIEDILKGLEQQLLAEQLKESPISLPELPKEPVKPAEEMKKTDEAQVPPSVAPVTEAPVPVVEASKVESPLPTEPPKPDIPLPEAPKVAAPQSEAPKPETPKTDAPKPEEPKAEAALPEAPKPPTPQAEVPKPAEPQPEQPKAAEQTKPAEPQPELPKAAEAPKTEAPLPPPKDAAVPTVDSASQIKSPAETQKDAPQEPAAQETAPVADSKTPAQPDADKKQKTPPKEQGKDAQKQAKQQAPQPPPKNGKQKKGQQPEPTSAHPLAETPIQPEAAKEEQKTAPQESVPLTPPTSPDSAETKVAEVQPGTPTITAPTPPVTPGDVPKTEDPLSAQLEGATSSGSTDAPVPPKRKGKEPAKQPPKQQSNGGKGKGKK